MLTAKVYFFLIYSIYLVIFSNGNISFDNDTNSTCIIKNSGLHGICTRLSSCKNAQNTLIFHKIPPTNCFYNQFEPIVCCSDIFEEDLDHHNCRKSKIQCYKNPGRDGIFATSCWETTCKQVVTNIDDYDFKKCYLYAALNGVKTKIGDYPFMAAIGFRQVDGRIVFNCGGFLVTPDFVITAAHCTNLGGDSPVLVRTGGIGLDENIHIDADITISKIFIHPSYQSTKAYHDIAIIQLTRPSKDQSKCLSDKDFLDYTDKAVKAVGYGQISFGGPTSADLLEVDLRIVSNDECEKSYPKNDFLPQGIQPSQVCAIDRKIVDTQDTCQGDSGGPLVTYINNAPRLFGITSFGNVCGSKTPGVYTRIQFYYDWIESIIWPNV